MNYTYIWFRWRTSLSHPPTQPTHPSIPHTQPIHPPVPHTPPTHPPVPPNPLIHPPIPPNSPTQTATPPTDSPIPPSTPLTHSPIPPSPTHSPSCPTHPTHSPSHPSCPTHHPPSHSPHPLTIPQCGPLNRISSPRLHFRRGLAMEGPLFALDDTQLTVQVLKVWRGEAGLRRPSKLYHTIQHHSTYGCMQHLCSLLAHTICTVYVQILAGHTHYVFHEWPRR